MRFYNGSKASITLPLTSSQTLSIPPMSVSGNFLPNTQFLSLVVVSFDYEEIALIATGVSEINMCSQVSGACGFVVQSLDEAIERFNPKSIENTKESCGDGCPGCNTCTSESDSTPEVPAESEGVVEGDEETVNTTDEVVEVVDDEEVIEEKPKKGRGRSKKATDETE